MPKKKGINDLVPTEREKKYLDVVFTEYINGREITWKKLNREVGRKGVHDVTKKFIEYGIIKKEDKKYYLNEENLSEIRSLVKRQISTGIKRTPIWEGFIKRSDVVLLVLMLVLFSLVYFKADVSFSLTATSVEKVETCCPDEDIDRYERPEPNENITWVEVEDESIKANEAILQKP